MVQTGRKLGTATPILCNLRRILILSVERSATSKGMPGKFNAFATAATV